MEYEKLLVCKNETLEIIESTPYLNLLLSALGGTIEISDRVFENIEDTVESVIESLTERERDVIIQRYGLKGTEPKTLEELGVQFNVSSERIRQIEAKALRKLRHPSRARVLKGMDIIDFSSGYCLYNYNQRIEDIIKEELKCIVEGKRGKTLYVDAIKKRNGIKINKENKLDNNTLIKDTDLSVRVQNCLSRRNIFTIAELQKVEQDDLIHIRNLGSKGLKEILQKLREIERCEGEEYNSIEFIRNGEKVIYKYSDEDADKIAKSLFNMLLSRKEAGRDIFAAHFSPGLTELLLLKGYLYEKDIYDDAEELEKQLNSFGFAEYEYEINTLKKRYQQDKEPYEPVFIAAVSEEIIEFINKNKCDTPMSFLEIAVEQGSEEIIDLALNMNNI